MRNKYSILVLLSLVLQFVVVGCTIETSGNGSLDGAWHLLRINDEAPAQTQLYWSFQGKMLELRDKKDSSGAYLLRFQRKDDELKLSEPHIYGRENGDKVLEDSALLKPFGIDDIDEPYAVERLDNSRMTLKSSTMKLEFRKF